MNGTRIYEIHGMVPGNELPDRGKMVAKSPIYIPYHALTRGEMKLALLADQAAIYSAAFPEQKEYAQAYQMLTNALDAGVSNGVNFIGALYSPFLQHVAKEINQAVKQTAPASKDMLLGRESLSTGVRGVGANEFQFNFDHDCVQFATKAANKKYGFSKNWQWWEYNLNDSEHRRYYRAQKAVCKTRIEIEAIVNERITNASHHVLYHAIDETYPAIKNQFVRTKLILQLGGVAGLANATETDSHLMALWSETSILKRNSTGGVGTVGSVPSSFYLSPDPEAFNDSYALWQKNRVFDNPKKDKIKGIGIAPAVLVALVEAIAGALKAAGVLFQSLNAKKAGAMGSALNYGTPALESKTADFDLPSTTTPTESNNNMLLLGGAAVAAYLLLKD